MDQKKIMMKIIERRKGTLKINETKIDSTKGAKVSAVIR